MGLKENFIMIQEKRIFELERQLEDGRFSDNEHPRSPLVWFCNCGKTTTMDKDVTNNEHTI